MAKETMREQIKRLEEENERLTTNFNNCFAENQQLQRKLNARVEDTDEYKSMIQRLQSMEQQRDTAARQHDHYKTKVLQLEDTRDALRQQLADLQAAYDALKATHEYTTQRNPFGAGRKRGYAAKVDQIMQLRANGLSIRAIARELDIPFATVARYIKESVLK